MEYPDNEKTIPDNGQKKGDSVSKNDSLKWIVISCTISLYAGVAVAIICAIHLFRYNKDNPDIYSKILVSIAFLSVIVLLYSLGYFLANIIANTLNLDKDV